MACVMGATNRESLKLPDQLIVRYFRGRELDAVRKVVVAGTHIEVRVKAADGLRVDRWQDLGGGLGFVPAAD